MADGAERLHRLQSAVSLQLKRLEAVLGRRVFDRHGRCVELTDAGRNLLTVARDVTTRLDSILREIGSDGLSGKFRIGIPDDHGRARLAQIIGAFAQSHPLVALDVTCALSARFPEDLASPRVLEPERLGRHGCGRSRGGDRFARAEFDRRHSQALDRRTRFRSDTSLKPCPRIAKGSHHGRYPRNGLRNQDRLSRLTSHCGPRPFGSSPRAKHPECSLCHLWQYGPPRDSNAKQPITWPLLAIGSALATHVLNTTRAVTGGSGCCRATGLTDMHRPGAGRLPVS
ncbi:MAG: LysR family transcriptional regulator [Pseudomonadota bacterium]